jgi:DNA-binding response OmpR family regulator
MAFVGTLLCIHRSPRQLKLLKEQGYGLLTATNGSDGLRLLKSHPVDAIVVEFYLGLLNGAVVADEIKLVKPHLPIVMVADPLDLPKGALNSVDALVAKSDGPHSVWAAVHFLLNRRATRPRDRTVTAALDPHSGGTAMRKRKRQSRISGPGDEKAGHRFAAEPWSSVRNGTVQF